MGSRISVFEFRGPAGRLEALWKEPEGPPRGSAVLAHADPLRGGTMHFKVIHRMARALVRARYGVLRFNFRGVGASEGRYDSGRGEREDFRAALDEAEQRGGPPLLGGGFSFGATVALSVGAADPRVEVLLGAGVPLVHWKFDGLHPVGKPTLLLSGVEDEFLGNEGRESLAGVAARVFSNLTVTLVRGADHFFTGRLDEFEAAVYDFANRPAFEVAR